MIQYEGRVPEKLLLNSTVRPLFDTPQRLNGPDSADGWSNRLYHGDNLGILSSLLDDVSIRGAVNLCYIDPPYGTGKKFFMRNNSAVMGYDDTMVGEKFCEFLRQRLIFIRELLSNDGCIYLHLDHNMICEAKLIMDEVFGPKNFRNIITREKCQHKNQTTHQYSDVADYILLYSKTTQMKWNTQYSITNLKTLEQRFPFIDAKTGERFNTRPVHAPETRTGATGGIWRGMRPPLGKHWVTTPAELDRLDENNELYWSPNGNPRRKVWATKYKGGAVTNIWTDVKDSGSEAKLTMYPSEKGLPLMRRVIGASSDPNDLVLDAFCGSGATLHAASELGRRWIGIDKTELAIENSVKRLSGCKSGSFDVWHQKGFEKNG